MSLRTAERQCCREHLIRLSAGTESVGLMMVGGVIVSRQRQLCWKWWIEPPPFFVKSRVRYLAWYSTTNTSWAPWRNFQSWSEAPGRMEHKAFWFTLSRDVPVHVSNWEPLKGQGKHITSTTATKNNDHRAATTRSILHINTHLKITNTLWACTMPNSLIHTLFHWNYYTSQFSMRRGRLREIEWLAQDDTYKSSLVKTWIQAFWVQWLSFWTFYTVS